MFHTADALGAGRFFWQSLLKLRRPPYDCVMSRRSATLLDSGRGLALVLVPSDEMEPKEECRVSVQLLKVSTNEMLVDATLSGDLQYLHGKALGLPADELAAAETLSMYANGLRGDWVIAEGTEAMDEDDQHE